MGRSQERTSFVSFNTAGSRIGWNGSCCWRFLTGEKWGRSVRQPPHALAAERRGRPQREQMLCGRPQPHFFGSDAPFMTLPLPSVSSTISSVLWKRRWIPRRTRQAAVQNDVAEKVSPKRVRRHREQRAWRRDSLELVPFLAPLCPGASFLFSSFYNVPLLDRLCRAEEAARSHSRHL